MIQKCIGCGSQVIKKNGFTRHGKQNHRCLACGKQFSTEPSIEAIQQKMPTSKLDFLECRIIPDSNM